MRRKVENADNRRAIPAQPKLSRQEERARERESEIYEIYRGIVGHSIAPLGYDATQMILAGIEPLPQRSDQQTEEEQKQAEISTISNPEGDSINIDLPPFAVTDLLFAAEGIRQDLEGFPQMSSLTSRELWEGRDNLSRAANTLNNVAFRLTYSKPIKFVPVDRVSRERPDGNVEFDIAHWKSKGKDYRLFNHIFDTLLLRIPKEARSMLGKEFEAGTPIELTCSRPPVIL